MFPNEFRFKRANPRFKQGVLGGTLEGVLGKALAHDPESVKKHRFCSRLEFSARRSFRIKFMLTRQRLSARLGAFWTRRLSLEPVSVAQAWPRFNNGVLNETIVPRHPI